MAMILAAACHSSVRDGNPLAGAARSGDARQIRALIAGGADPNAFDAGGNEWTPLLHAVHKHQLGSAEALLEAGADPNRAAPGGLTPLEMAAGYGPPTWSRCCYATARVRPTMHSTRP